MRGSRGRRTGAATLLAVVLAVQGVAASSAFAAGFGHVSAADGALRPGCHHYRYHYVVKPGSDDWLLETWLYDPRGRKLGSGDLLSGSDPEHGHATFGICRATVVPGRFTIRARLRWYDPSPLPVGQPTQHTKWLPTAHFRLHRP
jgi:hypothetical protein